MRAYRVNNSIRLGTVRVIGHDGAQLGTMTRDEALTKARSLNLDLVEVAPGASPPICRLLKWDEFARYQRGQSPRIRSPHIMPRAPGYETVEKLLLALPRHEQRRMLALLKKLLEGDEPPDSLGVPARPTPAPPTGSASVQLDMSEH